ncbi:MAG TPA: alpha-glucosidase, partial [Acidobacteriaceae bacterium]
MAASWLSPLQAQQNPQQAPVVMEHDGSTVMFEPYAPNIVRVTLSMQHDPAVAAAGYGFVAKPNTDGWTHTSDEHGDTYRSSRLVVTLDASHHGGKPSLT